MSSTLISILSACGGIVAALFGLLGVRLNQRSALKAQRMTAEIERSKVDAMAYAEARQVWDSLIKDLKDRVEDQKHEISDLRREFSAEHATADQWRRRLEDIEQKRSGDRQAIHVLTEYIRDLLALIKKHELVPPPPPEGLDLQR